MKVYFQMVRFFMGVRETLLRDGWVLETEEQDVLCMSHPMIADEETARNRLEQLGLLTSGLVRIEFQPMSSQVGQPHRRVLIVEDNPDGRATLQQLLQLWGFEVEVAADGLQGVEKALAWHPDYAVVDIGLPGLDGYELARRVRAAFDGHVLLVALTGYGQPEDRRRAFQAGFDAHLTKPADLSVLSQLLGVSCA
jgi:CheY-like chemotaxis protein